MNDLAVALCEHTPDSNRTELVEFRSKSDF